MRVVKAALAAGLLAVVSAVAPSALAASGGASSGKGVSTQEIDIHDLQRTVIGQPFHYPDGKPVPHAYIIRIAPGGATTLHKHDVPVVAYVLSGELEVDYGSKGTKRFKPGRKFVEAIDWCHRGRAVGKTPVMLAVVVLGDDTSKNTIACKG